MTWTTPLHTFKCGACGTTVTGIHYISDLLNVMRLHDEFCKGFAPPNHETPPSGNDESRATESGVTPAEARRVARAASSGRGE